MEEFIGTIKMFAGTFAPRGWAYCQGQIMSIAQNQALFSLLGTTYGGNGQTTFALPNLEGRVPVGTGAGSGLSPYELGQMGGKETTRLIVENLPAHSHGAKLSVSSGNAAQDKATSGVSIATPGYPDGRKFTPTYGYNTSNPDTGLNEGSVSVAITGGSQPFDNRQPYTAMNYIICLHGIYPPRD